MAKFCYQLVIYEGVVNDSILIKAVKNMSFITLKTQNLSEYLIYLTSN